MFQRKPSKRDFMVLRGWHALLAGAFLVAFVTGDEDTYKMHVFSGYAVLATLMLRPLLAIGAPASSPLRLPRPSLSAVTNWLSERRGRNPLLPWMAVAVLAAVAVSAVTGALADAATWMEHPHEELSEGIVWVIAAHTALAFWVFGGVKRVTTWLGARRAATALTLGLLMVALAAPAFADPARDALLSGYLADAKKADPSFAGFSAQRGESLFRNKWAGGDERTDSCTSCHTGDPRQPGRNAKTGRAIDPVAVSVNPKRFTDRDTVEKQFGRDCKSVLGRECTAAEKGDYITFMKGQ
jgi:hypothetical protein